VRVLSLLFPVCLIALSLAIPPNAVAATTPATAPARLRGAGLLLGVADRLLALPMAAVTQLTNADGLPRAPMVNEGTFPEPEGHAPCKSKQVKKVGDRFVCPECADLPAHIKKHAVIGRQKDLPDGFLVYQETKSGRLMVTPLGRFDPRPVPGIEKVNSRMDVSDDGKWVVTYRPRNQPVLVALDGAGAYDVPHGNEIKWDREEESFIGFWHSYPGSGSAIWIASIDKIYAINVDFRGSRPAFGPLRVIAALQGRLGAGWMRDAAVAGRHAFGGLGAPYSMLTLGEGGQGTAGATGLWFPTGQARFSCGCSMSWDGTLTSHNPGGAQKTPPLYDKAIPGGGTHTGPIILDFKEAKSPVIEAADLEIFRSASVNWAPREYYSRGHDWHEWHFSNHREYLTCRMLYTPQGQKEPEKGGIWILHWPSNTWTQITPTGIGGRGDRHVAYLTKMGTKRLPPTTASATSRPALAEPTTRPAPARLTVEATITDVSSVPAPKDLGTYRNVLTYIRYRVDKVVEGQMKDQHIIVVQWAVRDRIYQPAASYRVGQKQRIECELFDVNRHGDFMSMQQVNDIQDFDSRNFWALRVSPLTP
jgi:hypothetical protein